MLGCWRLGVHRQGGGEGSLDPRIAKYAADSYPHNHNYRVANGGIVAGRKLANRFRRISRHYVDPLESLLDISCSKGFFVLHAAARPSCRRALGIDIDSTDLETSRSVQAFLGLDKAAFYRLRLDELAEQIDQFGGPFQTVLVINCYQYLFFGSERSADAYFGHREIFRLLAKVCSNRVVFSNRTEYEQLQDFPRQRADRCGMGPRYNTEQALRAASEFFVVRPQGRLGRLPLWTLVRRD